MPEVTRDFEIDRSIGDTWQFFMAPDEIAPCFPGCQSYEEVGEDVFDAEIQVNVAYTDLVFDAHVELLDQHPPNSAVVEATAEPTGRIPGSATVEGGLQLRGDGHHTVGELEIEFAIRGRLGSLGTSAFKHKCEQLVDEFLGTVTDELEGEAE